MSSEYIKKNYESKIIHITHFINPNCFYFKFDDDLFNRDLHDLEKKIADYANFTESNKNVQPKPGEIVAAYIATWSKWIRAQVRSVSQRNEIVLIEVWAIDHGRSLEITNRLIRSLPHDLCNERTSGAFQGSILCIPSKRVNVNTFSVNYMKIKIYNNHILELIW